jgi:hypothetical protein
MAKPKKSGSGKGKSGKPKKAAAAAAPAAAMTLTAVFCCQCGTRLAPNGTCRKPACPFFQVRPKC